MGQGWNQNQSEPVQTWTTEPGSGPTVWVGPGQLILNVTRESPVLILTAVLVLVLVLVICKYVAPELTVS